MPTGQYETVVVGGGQAGLTVGYLLARRGSCFVILVVGAGNSGTEIAIELARHGRSVWLAGNNVGHIPAMVLG